MKDEWLGQPDTLVDMANAHETVTMTDLYGEPADIDKGLAALIAECWRLKIDTAGCCQDVGESLAGLTQEYPHLADYAERRQGRASIDFADSSHAAEFLTTLANHGPRDGAFYARMTHWATPGAWTKTVQYANFAEDEDGPARFAPWLAVVSFPSSDIDEITKRLRASAV